MTLRYSEAYAARGSVENLSHFTIGQRKRLATLLLTPREKWSANDVEFAEEFFGSIVDNCNIDFIPPSHSR